MLREAQSKIPKASPTEPFCKLAEPANYVACPWDLVRDDEARDHWVEFFKRHVNTILRLGVNGAVARGEAESSAEARADACRAEFYETFDRFAANPQRYENVSIVTLDRWRDGILRRHGFVDPFADLKRGENEKILPLLPAIVRELDQLDGEGQFRALVEGVFAGNIFDMGADATSKAFLSENPPTFAEVRAKLAHPWLIDDYEAFANRMLGGPVQNKAVFFIDNAGSDFLLGAVPMIRWLARRGTRVVIAANECPTLNDMTVHDVREWWPRVIATEPSLASLPIEIVSTGTGEPLIDLSEVSPELNAAAADAELIVLEGMGRGVESNLEARFTCDCVHLAMIKDIAVAKRHGGKVYDVVCRFKPA